MGRADLEDKEQPLYDPEDPDAAGPPPFRQNLSRYWANVNDGGDAYWHVFLNLDKEKVEGIAVNGHA